MTTAEYEFDVILRLPPDADEESVMIALEEAGLDDAAVGVGVRGEIALSFVRDAGDARMLLADVTDRVLEALPGATIIEIGPDLMTLREMAPYIGCTWQALQRYETGTIGLAGSPFPPPTKAIGKRAWQLYAVLQWIDEGNMRLEVRPELTEIALAAAEFNHRIVGDSLRKLK